MSNEVASIHVNVGVETADVQTGISKGRAAVRKGTAAMATDARRGVGVMRTEFAKFGQQVAGAPAAISAASNAMVAFGGKSAGAIGAVGGAFASLLASGFTPLGVAIAGATVAFAHFASSSNEASKASDELTAKVKQQEAAFGQLIETMKKAESTRAGLRFGGGDVGAVQVAMAEAALRLESAQADFERLRRDTGGEGETFRLAAKELREAESSLRALGFLADAADRASRASRTQRDQTRRTVDPARTVADEAERALGAYRLSVDEIESIGDEMERVAVEAENARIRRNEFAGGALDDAIDFARGSTTPFGRVTGGKRVPGSFAEAEAEARALEETTKRIAAAMGQVRAPPGFRAEVDQLRLSISDDKRMAAPDPQVFTGAASAASGLTSALGDIARGSQEASDAIRDFGVNFLQQMASMILQATLLRTIMGALGFTQTATGSFVESASIPAAAHGGTFRVGGSGGIDSQLVALRASPGEMVRVTNGANSAGEYGPVQVALTVRPPAVIADEVMARSSSRARAAVTASALSRPGRRGRRAT